MGFALELLRVVLLMLLAGGLLGELLKYVYAYFGADLAGSEYGWLIGVVIYVWIFVLYRNLWQFSGWYKGNGRRKLSRRVTWGLLGGSAVLAVIIPWLG
ncbi:hypothetical protein [Brevibacillus brevis]|uniref:Uncharacterized protein n=1 Tax=Brevibacillus brevis TaxID=1393 RepID=A0ABY9T096_BREBE|nr:hypothetical protein [Brevibacillus brevis]WNC13406.1 hypothetical protein RGB73_22305 [Brevibacillus brevis]